MGDRNSYSKINPDATLMTLKEYHMSNGQLKPAYNVQISTSNQFLVEYNIDSNPTDTLAEYLKQYEHSFGASPQCLTADADTDREKIILCWKGKIELLLFSIASLINVKK